jgi:hypothetical protein
MQPLSEAPPLPLFACGPLGDPVFAGQLLERRLASEPAVLEDHLLAELSDAGDQVAVPAPGQEAHGLLYRYLTAADYDRLDAYQGVGEDLYARRRAEARTAADGAAEPVFVYLPTDRAVGRYR